MIGEIRQNFTEASASVGLILATALNFRKKTEQVYVTGKIWFHVKFFLTKVDSQFPLYPYNP